MTKYSDLLPPTKSDPKGQAGFDWTATEGDGPAAGVLTLSSKRDWCRYKVEEFPADIGRGFALFKIDAGTDATEERYFCLVGKRVKQCDCKGFAYTGGCKHVAALVALVEAGKL